MPKKEAQSVLVIEENAAVRGFLEDYLKSCGYKVSATKDGKQATGMLKEKKFDFAVADFDAHGEQVQQALASQPGIKTVPINPYPTGSVSFESLLGLCSILGPPEDTAIARDPTQSERKDAASDTEKKEITSMMEENRILYPSPEFTKNAAIPNMKTYNALYNWSVKDPETFWGHLATQLDWYKKWDKFTEWDFKDKPYIRYFIGGKINISYNCLDRHLGTWRKNKAAIIWQGEGENEVVTYTYQQLYREVCKFANVLRKLGIKKGDTVTIYMPMIPEAAVAMLACTRIGAVHSVVFSGFSSESLRDRMLDCKSKLLISADGYHRNGQIIRCKDAADMALAQCPGVKDQIVVRRLGLHIEMYEGRDRWWHDEMSAADIALACEPEAMDAEDPLFILYTSGSTGKPKGILHTQAGYLLHCYQTMKWVFDIKDSDIFWCTADIGWVTGHSYVVYGPLACGATSLMFEGTPTFPQRDRVWQICEKFNVNVFYTAPTLIRALMREGEEWPKKHDLSCLRLLGTVGEPINPEAWMWYYEVIGQGRCPIVDTWWQTETGGHLITPLPGAIPTKPGSATVPFFGVEPVIVNKDGKEVSINEGGYLCVKKPWPGIARTIYGDPEKFKATYFTRFPGLYFTGDGARKDQDGYYWLMGRIDDVLNVSGHRIGTAEVESALVSHPRVAEAAVVGIHHEIKGQGIYAFVTLRAGIKASKALEKDLKDHVRQVIGPIARPDKIQFADALPKTRSGKIMRRILVKIANGDISNLGDTSTLADPSVVESLVRDRV